MVTKLLNKLSPRAQANLILIAGIVLLLSALNVVKGLNIIIALISVVMIWYGFTQAGYNKTIKGLLSKKQK